MQIFHHLRRMDYLIRTKATGSPCMLASRLEISERCVYNYLKLMKEMGAPIKFSRERNSYYYDCEGKFILQFVEES